MIATQLCVAALFFLGELEPSAAFAFLLGGSAIALVGIADDQGSLSVVSRMAVHFAAATAAVWALGGIPVVQVGDRIFALGFIGDAIAVLAVVWVLNLFNFMDGIDGIAASEAMFIGASAAALMYGTDAANPLTIVAISLAGASMGFLLWNWPPAKIFMGDVGSGFLGYMIAVLALDSGRSDVTMPFVWLTLGGVFFVDASVTLVRRFLRKEKLSQAHRTHAYQWLARRWNSHGKVTLLVSVINVTWLLPIAWLEVRYPDYSLILLSLALLPLVMLAYIAGAGRPERPRSRDSSVAVGK